jgi:SAM-dependent methyltransferase
MSYCPQRRELFCIECAPENRAVRRGFWGWSYYFSLRCRSHAAWHPALDRLEFTGGHPWQLESAWRREKRGMSRVETVPPRWSFSTDAFERITDRDVRQGWDDVASWWVGRYSEKGDINREWVIDPALLRMAGDVRNLRVLDAGCGGGYLSRILAKQGAHVTGVDLSPKLLAEAKAQETRAPLGIRFLRRDLARLTSIADESFDLVVANVVLQDVRRLDEAVNEIARVLKPRGRFLFSITHPSFDIPPAHWVREPEDTERPEERPFMAVDHYFDRVSLSWAPHGLPPVVGFHRPLRDFTDAVFKAGLVIHRLEEPLPLPEALRTRYRQFADQVRVPNFLIVEARKR